MSPWAQSNSRCAAVSATVNVMWSPPHVPFSTAEGPDGPEPHAQVAITAHSTKRDGASRNGRATPLSLHEVLDGSVDAVGDVELALRAYCDEVRLAELADAFSGLSRCREHLAIQIEPQNLPGKAVDHVDVLVPDIQRTRQTGVFQFLDEFSVGIEDLDSLVFAVGDPEQAFGVNRNSMRDFEFSRLLAFPAPGFDETTSLVELEDAWISSGTRSVPLHDKDVSAAAERDVIRLIQVARSGGFVPCARLSLGSQRQERLSLRIHLDDNVGSHVGHPDVAVPIESQAMCPREESLAKGANELAGRVELDQRLRPSIQHPEMAFRIERDARGRPHRGARGKCERIRHGDVIELRRVLREEQRGVGRPLCEGRSTRQQREHCKGGDSHRLSPLTT